MDKPAFAACCSSLAIVVSALTDDLRTALHEGGFFV
ncbi:putative phage associated protein [Neisseria meningitidis alpha14]|uniref:Putative phage associated protein n=1 Tax=Neisseria meningitidis (strain alpha14) TaxID=662598 RepID=C6S6E9_NEIML|nr:putative phage associated protein [Neisseria meningitidis alpha14]